MRLRFFTPHIPADVITRFCEHVGCTVRSAKDRLRADKKYRRRLQFSEGTGKVYGGEPVWEDVPEVHEEEPK